MHQSANDLRATGYDNLAGLIFRRQQFNIRSGQTLAADAQIDALVSFGQHHGECSILVADGRIDFDSSPPAPAFRLGAGRLDESAGDRLAEIVDQLAANGPRGGQVGRRVEKGEGQWSGSRIVPWTEL